MELNTILYTTMIKAHSKTFQLEKALMLFNEMTSQMKTNMAVAPNNISFNSLIDCCIRCFNMPKAAEIFN